MRAMTATPHIALLLKDCGNTNPFLVHSPTVAHGSCFLGGMWHSEQFVLSGLGTNATPLLIDPSNIAKKVKTGRLPYTELLAASSSKELSTVKAPESRTASKIRNVALVLNFILTSSSQIQGPQLTWKLFCHLIAQTAKAKAVSWNQEIFFLGWNWGKDEIIIRHV